MIFKRYPKSFTIETTSYCNLACVYCDRRKMTPDRFRHMNYGEFVKILRNIMNTTKIRHIDLDLSGEPLLNKDTHKMVRYASNLGIKTFFSTNATYLKENTEEILNSGLTNMLISFDGMTKETYERYRIRGNFEKVKEGIEYFMAERNKKNKKSPHVTLSAIMFSWNANDKQKFIDFARDNGIDNILLKSPHFGTFKNDGKDKYMMKEYNRFEYNVVKPCSFYKDRGTILSNGDVSTCCVNLVGEPVVGNLLKQDFKDVWDSIEMKKMKDDIKNRRFDFCGSCLDGTDGNMGDLIKL